MNKNTAIAEYVKLLVKCALPLRGYAGKGDHKKRMK